MNGAWGCGARPWSSTYLSASMWMCGHGLTPPRSWQSLDTPNFPPPPQLWPLPAMFSSQGGVEVASASPYAFTTTKTAEELSSPPAQDASGCLDTINTLFAAPAARKEQEPSAKRRKVGDGNFSLPSRPATFDQKKSVVLARISLDLVSMQPSLPCDRLTWV